MDAPDTEVTEENVFVRSGLRHAGVAPATQAGDGDRTKNLLPSGIYALSENSANSSEALNTMRCRAKRARDHRDFALSIS